MNGQMHAALQADISLLGKMLDEAIKQGEGETVFKHLETIRRLSSLNHNGDGAAQEELITTLEKLNDEDFVPIVRGFTQFLNLVNTAEQYHSISPNTSGATDPVAFSELYETLKMKGVDDKDIISGLENLSINLVLTAHPTEINRQSLNVNLAQVDACLGALDHRDLPEYRKRPIYERLRQLISQYWYTDEIRKVRPSVNEEARWGLQLVGNSLWKAVPDYLRRLDLQVKDKLNISLPVDARPIFFSSWMGGDRDGNPNVTAKTTREVMNENRLVAAKMYAEDIDLLVWELSMWKCSDRFRKYIGDDEVQEPYRELMRRVRTRLGHTITYLEALDRGERADPHPSVIMRTTQLWEPLYECYLSLVECGMEIIANDKLLDTMRRTRCFGITLTQMDIRQESIVHTEALAEITQFIGLGDYSEWDEEKRLKFLIEELNSNRPLLPRNWTPSEKTKELFDTIEVITETNEGVIPCYIISMTSAASDVLAVHLLLKEFECPYFQPVTPLFETLNDLNNSERIMNELFEIEWYKKNINGKQMVMIGYSDSAKDAGSLAAGWAQYRSQERLLKVSDAHNVALTLFHGRGGTVGRGGGPAKFALFSQPPGSLKGGLRVTEQGEMMRFKLGMPELAVRTLSLYTDAILEANLTPPPIPKPEWRDMMDSMSDHSCEVYQGVVYKDDRFTPYFYQATPVQELGKLPLSSRPAKRRPTGGVETLRAIPWIFGWTQNRLLLPAWLGAGTALQKAIDDGHLEVLRTMKKEWPFFNTRISILEMVFAKTNLTIARKYDEQLVEPSLRGLGEELRAMLEKDINTILSLDEAKSLREALPIDLAENLSMRTVHTDPLNLLQIELLSRARKNGEEHGPLERALMITISGIAAGMRNTG
ncbi:putative Phosphoenolpyruvate carboxylase [Blattamonas nauphoetae]|uniref:phosphoenolpyruvate carboxylase n=1 Tax=Blattamonas nauphoetae TaxID=2049346 RepID=A0ABQ9YAP2_9EUKA|nr:putative Phosphoenolpyruvate carboxylase [Blattamonas nauphoetae]